MNFSSDTRIFIPDESKYQDPVIRKIIYIHVDISIMFSLFWGLHNCFAFVFVFYQDADVRPTFLNLEMKLLKLSDSGDYSS